VFTCSPIAEDEKSLIKLAKRMKKNNISIDFIHFGSEISDSENTKKLESFIENVKSSDGSNLVTIHPGPNLLSDSLVASPILSGDGVGGSAGAGGEGGDTGGAGESFEFGVDPSMDPELALALRMSFEEEKQRVEKEKREKDEREAKEGKGSLEGITEEDENTPLLDKDKAGEGSVSKGAEGNEDKKDDGNDKMDTA
jgi:26S proteasome regulatory subunit N10